jgi:hypothetical protein
VIVKDGVLVLMGLGREEGVWVIQNSGALEVFLRVGECVRTASVAFSSSVLDGDGCSEIGESALERLELEFEFLDSMGLSLSLSVSLSNLGVVSGLMSAFEGDDCLEPFGWLVVLALRVWVESLAGGADGLDCIALGLFTVLYRYYARQSQAVSRRSIARSIISII